jgi:hypothetical protein
VRTPRRPKKTRQDEDAVEPALIRPALIRWSLQDIRRSAVRLAQQRIQPAHVMAWSLWRRAHQAAARHCHMKIKKQL